MTQKTIRVTLAIVLCLSVSLAYAQRGKEKGKPGGGGRSEPSFGGQPGRGGAGGGQPGRESAGNSAGAAARKPGGTTPGGEWSQRSYGGKPSGQQPGRNSADAGAGAAFEKNKAGGESGNSGKAAGAAAFKNNSSTPSGAEGAAAGKAAAGRNSSNATGAEGAAAGAAAVNRNESTATGAQGAAAGAAAASRKSPTATGAEGAAAGAAAVNRNQPTLSGAQGAAAGAAIANSNSSTLSGATGAAAGYAAVRNSFNNPNMYGQQWYGTHPGAWATPAGWAAGAVWTPAAPSAVANYGGYSNAAPVSYNYGDNVQYQNGNVTVDGQSVGTAAEYSQQAADLAQLGTDAKTSADDDWLSLGVFALVRDENQKPQLFMQFAINKQGILRGNYTDEANGHTSPIHGAVDKQTQRAAWTVGDNQQSVMEAGINNLTQGEAPALIHKNGKTDHWILIRLDQPKTAQN